MDTIFGAQVPFAELCAIKAIGVEGGVTRIQVVLTANHMNQFGNPHGGLIATILDIAMGSAARLAVGAPITTLDTHISYLGKGWGLLIAEGRIVRAGKFILFAEASLQTSDGTTIAKSSGVFKASERPLT